MTTRPVSTDLLLALGPQPAGEPLAISAPALPADRHPAAVYLARLAPGSRRAMSGALNTIAGLLSNYRHDMKTLPWSELRYQHTAAIRSLLSELYSPATANKMLAALRGVLKEAWRLGQMPVEEFQKATDLPAIRGDSALRGRALSRGELARLFEVCSRDSSPPGLRDAALLAILYGAGLRRSELVALDLSDFQTEQCALRIRRGKGNKSRICYLSDEAAGYLRAWLHLRGAAPGPIFHPINKAGKLAARRLSDQAVRKILLNRARQAGLESFSPHDLRRTMIGELLDAGVDIVTVQKIAGHATVTTTARYDRRGEVAKRKAASLLKLASSVLDTD